MNSASASAMVFLWILRGHAGINGFQRIVRATVSVIAEVQNTKTRKRQPAFSKQEFDACRRLLLYAYGAIVYAYLAIVIDEELCRIRESPDS